MSCVSSIYWYRLMQNWLFHNAPWFWKSPQIKALLTSVPQVGHICLFSSIVTSHLYHKLHHVMQCLLFPTQGRMLVLDLFSEAVPLYHQTHFYYGQPFIWCLLQNSGGTLGFFGRMEIINTVCPVMLSQFIN